jgi:hypothetical protein
VTDHKIKELAEFIIAQILAMFEADALSSPYVFHYDGPEDDLRSVGVDGHLDLMELSRRILEHLKLPS